MDLWATTVDARRSMLETFAQLDVEEWEVPSLCEGWNVREVLAHLALAARPPATRDAPVPTVAGRPTRLDGLDGDGVPALREWGG